MTGPFVCAILMLMIIVVLGILGLTLGSFVNAFVWRFHEHRNWVSERSECVDCHHALSARDLIPIFSWLLVGGKCRYCHKKISIQYPLVELLTALVFILSYLLWPVAIISIQIAIFALWLINLTGLISLLIYDLRWMLLPTKIVYSLTALAIIMGILNIISTRDVLGAIISYVASCAIGGGIFYILFQISKGKWIGGGDVRLGFLLGIIAATAGKSFLLIFIAAALGSLVSIPLFLTGKLKANRVIPFGPFLIVASFIVQFEGSYIIRWYMNTFIPR